MANEKHLLVVCSGDYTATAAALTQETWQTGIRATLVFGSVDDIGTLPNNWDPAPKSINRTESGWTITGNWMIDGPGLETWEVDDWLNDQLAPAFTSWVQRTNCFSQRVQLNTIKVYPIGAGGQVVPAPPYAVGTPVTLTFTGTPPGGALGGALLPPQLSVVASHRTTQVGRRGRGRSFLPPGSALQLSEGILGSTYQTALLNSQVTLLEDIAYDNAGPGTSTIRPIITGQPFVDYAVITQVQVDSILDTQRRRRRSAQGTTSSAQPSY